MKYKTLCILLFLLLLPNISAGQIFVNPNPVFSGNNIVITMYATPTDPMDCGATIHELGKSTILGFVDFPCDSHCRCYNTVNTTFFVPSTARGYYSVTVWDYLSDNFYDGNFNVLQNKCKDGIKDYNETDIDCGGDSCEKCINEKTCKNNNDCISLYCNTSLKCEDYISLKNLDKYKQKEVFIVSDQDYKQVLKLVSLSVWNENSKKTIYPVLIYHKEGDKFDFDSGIHFLQLYSPDHITIFGDSPEKLDKLLSMNKDSSQDTIRDNPGKFLGAGINKDNITKVSFNDYYSYWGKIDNVVVSSDDYETGLMASVYASNKNAPLMFVSEISYGALAGKKVYVVGKIDNKTLSNIKKIANQTFVFNNTEIQKDYINITGSDKVIVVNPNDIDINQNKDFTTDKSSNINEIFSKNSLAAGFLAAIRDEVIISVNITGNLENPDCKNSTIITNNFILVNNSIKNQIKNLGFNPEYLTIFASPNTIPDSVYRKCHDTGYQFRNSTDIDYANFGNYTVNFGRIYGIDATDTSSYVARDIYYKEISSEIYQNNSTGLTIGHSIDSHMDNSQKIMNASNNNGYDSDCYTGSLREGCIKKYNPPTSEYSKKQFIIFGDHGFPGEWADTLKSNNIPLLDLSYIFSHACLTSNYWQGEEKLMSANMIRKGAISYQGAVGVGYSDNSEIDAIKILTSTNSTLGELNKELGKRYKFYKRDYILIGDPVFSPGLKKIDWNNYNISDGSGLNEIELTGPGNGEITDLENDKPVYNMGDKISITTKVKNIENTSKEFYLEYSIFSIHEKYDSELVLQKISLDPYSENEYNNTMDVSDTMPSGSYSAIVRLLNNPDSTDELDKKEIQFNVNGTLKTMDIIIKSCDDENCLDSEKIFEKNETIYMDYENSVDANIDALLIEPDGTTKSIELPYGFSTEKTGEYILIVNATKTGYQDLVEEMIFGVSDESNIPIIESCNLNKICDNNESAENCPQDCIFVNITEENNTENITCFKDTDCNDNNRYTENHCIDPGKSDSVCSNSVIRCFDDSECGENSYIDDYFCGNDNNILRDYITYTCNYKGTDNSSCRNSITIKQTQKCLTTEFCLDGSCQNNEDNDNRGGGNHNDYYQINKGSYKSEKIGINSKVIYTDNIIINNNQTKLSPVNEIKSDKISFMGITLLIITIIILIILLLIIIFVLIIKKR